MTNLNNLKVLVTGGAGFIGSNIVETMLRNGVRYLRVLDNLSTGHHKNIKPFLEKYTNLEFIYGDITNLDTCMKACNGMDVICHQAALGSVPRSVNDPLRSHNSNVNGMLNLLWAAYKNDIKRFVYASSSSVYGDNNILPKRENLIGKLMSPYAATKYINELYASIFTRLYGMECIGLRYFNIFGPRQDPNGPYAAVIPKFISQLENGSKSTINGDGSFSRDFTYVDNAVQANIKALILETNNNNIFGTVYNIGAGSRTTILELFNFLNDIMKTKQKPNFGPKRPGDVPHSHANISKANKKLGYIPSVNFKDGLVKTVKYFIKKS